MWDQEKTGNNSEQLLRRQPVYFIMLLIMSLVNYYKLIVIKLACNSTINLSLLDKVYLFLSASD